MNWKTACRSFCYQSAPEPEVPSPPLAETALLYTDALAENKEPGQRTS